MTEAKTYPATNEATVAAFTDAVLNGDASRLASLLRQDPDASRLIDEPLFGFDSTALIRASSRGDLALIDVLIDAGADVDKRSGWWAGGFAPIDNANAETASHLLERGASLTPHAAARLGWTARLRDLLAVDSSRANERGGDGMIPLHEAANPEIAALLLQHGADIDARDIDHNATPAQRAINDPETLRFLIDRGAEPDIFIAAKLGEIGLIRRVLATSPDAADAHIGEGAFTGPGEHIYTYILSYTTRPLFLAFDSGSNEAVQFLLEHASPSARLIYAYFAGDQGLARDVLAHNPDAIADASPRDRAAVADAAWTNRLETVKLLLDVGFPIDAKSINDSTALDRASIRGYADIVQLLLDHGASVHERNAFGGSPLSACLWGSVNWKPQGDYERCARMLLDAGSPDPGDDGSDAVRSIVAAHFGR